MNLSDLKKGESGKILAVGGEGALRQHILDMGLVPGAECKVSQFAPMGDPMQIQVHTYELTLRLEDAAKIQIEKIKPRRESKKTRYQEDRDRMESYTYPHPGLGEDRNSRSQNKEPVLSKDAPMTIALAGNQNSGKTTLFNAITGSDQRVGNFPGVTVEHKTASLLHHPEAKILDLPGIYSLSPYSSEERISRQYIIDEEPSCIIDVVDASNLERNLYLTIQLMELDRPMVLALNMMDEVRGNGGAILINKLEEELGIPVVPISASKNEGIQELIDHVIYTARYQQRPARHDFCSPDDPVGEAIHRCIHSIMPFIEDHAGRADLPLRFAADKLVEGDPYIKESLDLDPKEDHIVEGMIRNMEEEGGMDRAAAVASMRYRFIHKLVLDTVIPAEKNKEYTLSRKIDKLMTGKYTAIPIFIAIMCLVFWLTFDVIGGNLQELMETGISWIQGQVSQAMTAAGVNPILHSLVVDGALKGVGAVLSFLPIIVTLFFFLSLMEDSGYIARVAFTADKFFRKLGLSGRSIVPMIIGFGCTVPAVMSTRTLPSERDRKMTVFLTPFFSCSAKLPIYAFFSQAFFPDHATLVMSLLYVLGILIAFLVAVISKKFFFKGESMPFVLELPNYRFPSGKNVLRLITLQAGSFVKRAFSVIFIGSMVIWFLNAFDPQMNFITNPENSLLAHLAGAIAPIFRPMGLDDWRLVSSLFAGFMAKESVISTLNILFRGLDALVPFLSIPSAAAFLVFCLLYTPCIAAVQAISRELGKKDAFLVVLFQCGVAWLFSFITYRIALLF